VRYDVSFDVNEAAFKAAGVSNILDVKITAMPLPLMRNVTLSEVLSCILERVPADSGATFFVGRDEVEITTRREAAITAFVGLKKQSRYLVESIQTLSLNEPSFFIHEASTLFSDVVHWHRVLVDNARHLRANANTARPEGK